MYQGHARGYLFTKEPGLLHMPLERGEIAAALAPGALHQV
jgi:hypothetical protein